MFRRLASALGWTPKQVTPQVIKNRLVNVRTDSVIHSSASVPQKASATLSVQADAKSVLVALNTPMNVDGTRKFSTSSVLKDEFDVPSVNEFVSRKKQGSNRVIKCLVNETKFDSRPLVLPSVKLDSGRRVRVALTNRYDMDMACRFLEAQFDTENHFEQGLGSNVSDMEIHFYEACKRSLFCPFSLIAFEDDQVVGLLLCSSRNHQPRKQTEPFSLKSNYDLVIESGPYLRRKGNRVKAFEDILLNEYPYLVDKRASSIGRIEVLVTIPEYENGQLERILLREALKRAADSETQYLGALAATDLHRSAYKEVGFTPRLDVPFADFVDHGFRGPQYLSDPHNSTRMTLMIAKTELRFHTAYLESHRPVTIEKLNVAE